MLALPNDAHATGVGIGVLLVALAVLLGIGLVLHAGGVI